MQQKKVLCPVLIIMVVVSVLGLYSYRAHGHCDTLDGPVIHDARLALEKGDVRPVLKWVKREHADEIREMFVRTLDVRKLNAAAKSLADNYFFENLVRIHRAGEGAAYTGLKPAGAVDPAIAAADKALNEGSVDVLVEAALEHVENGIRERFTKALEARRHANDSVEAGRKFVEAYVSYAHYVEGIHEAASAQPSHAVEAGAATGHAH